MASVRTTSQMAFKDNDTSRPLSPPPAYAPSPQTLTARPWPTTCPRPLLMARCPTATLLSGSAGDEGAEWEEGLSPISLRINTSVTVTSDDNMVCLVDTPATHANAIALAVVKALQQSSSGQCGIPMIDEEGRPRPVRIHVDAGLTVGGAGNVVGNEAVIREAARQRGGHDVLRRRRSRSDDLDHGGRAEEGGPEEGGGSPAKRRRC
ncbi:hypothetical protein G6O67_007000 [Ophiocordyceps sinensis]|uniref:Uncharacterized protein n=2 Tax=Ophiocordyceps sinensis TaxID=72228 RepID=A0A8H4LTW6_9HYPO|nr:hypothetical protein OCS_06118 [Ophiocordyceps sinensis CO18]KAF4505002.1 hypothetical protein G6O67_007000 [Ophiocordyceps sinensis]